MVMSESGHKEGGKVEGKDILSTADYNRKKIEAVFDRADFFSENPRSGNFKHMAAALCFFEPSTRTYTSFDLAMKYQGGVTTGFHGTAGTSVEKGESLEDTIKTIDSYDIDAIIIRHPEAGAAARAADVARAPVINAGDGSNEHPTQALLDLYTLFKRKGSLDGLNIGILGDLKYGRTVHSLLLALRNYENTISLISPDALNVPDAYSIDIRSSRNEVYETNHLEDVLPELDVLYVTRIQKERFKGLEAEAEYERLKGSYNIGKKILSGAKKDLMIMHPLPNAGELATELYSTPNAAWFNQTRNSIAVRQALLAEVLGVHV